MTIKEGVLSLVRGTDLENFTNKITCNLCLRVALVPIVCETCGNIFCRDCRKKITECPLKCGATCCRELSLIEKMVYSGVLVECPLKCG